MYISFRHQLLRAIAKKIYFEQVVLLICILYFSGSDASLNCLTGAAYVGHMENVIMTFDGAVRTSTDQYEYLENPEITQVYPSEAFNA